MLEKEDVRSLLSFGRACLKALNVLESMYLELIKKYAEDEELEYLDENNKKLNSFFNIIINVASTAKRGKE